VTVLHKTNFATVTVSVCHSLSNYAGQHDVRRTLRSHRKALTLPEQIEGKKMAPRLRNAYPLFVAAYGVTVRLTENELVRGFVPPVVAVTTTE
jgi:hypothetical protein